MNGQAKLLLTALQRFDLLGTGCMSNPGMSDEYQSEACQIERFVLDGLPLRDAVIRTFEEQFWSDCLSETHRAQRLERFLTALTEASSDPT
jgi:hypothetical protein